MKRCIILIVASLLLFFSSCSQTNLGYATGSSQHDPGYVIGDDYYSLKFRIRNDEKRFIANIKKESAVIQGDKRRVYLQDKLLEAIDNDYRAAVLTLIELGVDINCNLIKKDFDEEAHLDIKEMLVQYGSPVEYAALQGKVLFLDLYLNANTDTPIKKQELLESFDHAINAERLEFAKLLIRSGFGPKKIEWSDLLHGRIRDKRIFKLLLDNGLNPNLFGRPSGQYGGYLGGKEPIFFRNREPEIVEMMIDYGADVNMTGRYKQTFLHNAMFYGGTSLAMTLIKRGAKVNATDANGDTPLLLPYIIGCFDIEMAYGNRAENYYRARYEDKDLYTYKTRRKDVGDFRHPTAQWLINAGADVNYRNENDGLTALHYVTALQDIGEIYFLIKNGANINARDNNGNTPLHIAAMHHLDESYIKQLMDYGADGTIKNNDGNTPQDILAKWKNETN